MTGKTIHRFFTISDFEKEEDFLRDQHRNGYALETFTGLSCYRFQKCEPKDVVYRLDYCGAEKGDKEEYIRMFQDYGWEYLFDRFGWSYFRKENTGDEDAEIFSDNSSRLALVEKVFKTRMLPILILFFFCVLPQLFNSIPYYHGFLALWVACFAIYLYIIIHCGLGFLRLKKKYQSPAQ